MTLQKQSALHHRRGLLNLPGAGTTIQERVATTVDQPTTTATPAKPAVTAVAISNVPAAVLSSVSGNTTTTTTSTSTSSTASTTSSVQAKSSTTPSTPTVTTHSLSIPSVTSATRSAVVHTTTTLLSSTSPYAQVSSTAAQVSTGTTSTVTLIGGIGGALGGTILLTVLLGFCVRRWRKKNARNTFDASRFRRSAVLLDGKADDTYGRPRPPTMIERKNISPTPAATSLASPPTAYPHSDQPPVVPPAPLSRDQSLAQHDANQTQYGAVPFQPPSFTAGNQFGGNGGATITPGMHYPRSMDYGQGHEQAGYGAPPIPGVHGPGTYASYGVDPRYPQSQRYRRPQRQFGQQQNQQDQPRQGLAIDNTVSGVTRKESVSSLANPFTPLPAIKKMEPIEGFGPTTSTVTSNTGLTRGTSFVTRQPHEAPPAYVNNGTYTDVKRDVKVSPPSTSPPTVTNKSSDSTGSDTKAVGVTTTSTTAEPEPKPRPITVYDDDDVYGGM